MGTDISWFIERSENGIFWEPDSMHTEEILEEDRVSYPFIRDIPLCRNYPFFNILAGVRSFYGDNKKKAKGIPQDASPAVLATIDLFSLYSVSYMSVDELLECVKEYNDKRKKFYGLGCSRIVLNPNPKRRLYAIRKKHGVYSFSQVINHMIYLEKTYPNEFVRAVFGFS